MASDMEKKRLGWFKNQFSNQNETNADEVVNEPVEEQDPDQAKADYSEEPLQLTESDSNQPLFSRDNQDKLSLDAIVSIENLIKDRQLLTYKHQALDEQLENANETINRYKRELLKKDQMIQEKSKEIRDLETSLTNKQMSYDQLLEDYKEYQISHNLEYDKISNQLETEKEKYKKLYDESSKTQAQNMMKISELEERIRSLEIEKQKFAEQYEKIAEEKAKLMKTINDFTERMSFSFSMSKE